MILSCRCSEGGDFVKRFSPIICIAGVVILIISLIVSLKGSEEFDYTKSEAGLILLTVGEAITVLGVFSALS